MALRIASSMARPVAGGAGGPSRAVWRMAGASFTSSRVVEAPKIVYTKTDEAPMLATYALLPVIRRFAAPLGVEVDLADISVARRILSQWPEHVPAEYHGDPLADLGELAKTPDANIIKLPNVSASIPQLTAAIAELQSRGLAVPDFPDDPKTDEEKEIAATYGKVLGSAVNPVLREGNSDRRVAGPVKAFAQAHPKKMNAWSPDTRTSVSSMSDGDFFGSEKSVVKDAAGSVRIEFVNAAGETEVLRDSVELQAGEVIDCSRLSVSALRTFLQKELAQAKEDGIMISLHMKATMMKVSDPIIFGHVVKEYFASVFEKHASLFERLGVNANNGLGDVYDKLVGASDAERAEVEADIEACYATRPSLAMVNSAKGITNLHVPSDVIIDASMPNVVRDGGCMWNKDDALEETRCIIPDRSYAGIYQVMFDDCRANGQFDAGTMGNVSNVGLMAQKAEEYGSHDKTFELAGAGEVVVRDNDSGEALMSQTVETGDIFRMSQTKSAPIVDWIQLAVRRGRATGSPVIFWLDEKRAHDANLIKIVEEVLPTLDVSGLDISIMKPEDACKKSCEIVRTGKDVISVTGNVLRDYLTDLFPILELGTSAKMLSIVPLLAGGGLFETGAGGSAPKHVEQFVEEGHLRWDSLGEYLATAVSFEELGEKTGNKTATLLGATLNEATAKLLDENLSPSRKVNEIDNRGSTFYIAKYWAEAMAKHDDQFSALAKELAENEETITAELIDCQGSDVDIGGYWMPSDEKAAAAMRPSSKLNSLLDSF